VAIRVGAGIQTLSPTWWTRRTLARDQAAFGYVLLAPAALLMIVLVGVPFLRALWLSFHKKLLGAEEAPWIGAQNYSALLGDPTFWQAVANTFIFTIGSIGSKLVLGIVIALVLNETLPLRGLWRSIVMLPYAMPTLVSVLVWKWMYNDVAGVLNYLAGQAKLTDHPILWLGDPHIALPAVIAVNVWRGFPFFVITILAGLQTVPQELYDAAKVDGAGVWARFRQVTVPGVLPVVAVTTLFSTILTFNDFSIIWILTQGGPGNATQVLATLTYKISIPGLELGKGVAVSVLMLPILVGLIVLLNRFIARREELA
jgi:multiple sugar transport system permease protein